MATHTLTPSRPAGDTHAGAQAFLALMENVRTISNATCTLGEDDSDARDYRSIAALIESSVLKNLDCSVNAKHREGFLRALTDLLTLNADGCGVGDDWDPIAATARAFTNNSTARSRHEH